MEPLPPAPLPPAPITPHWLALREELKEFHDKRKALDSAVEKNSPPKNLQSDTLIYRECLQKRIDFLRLELLLDNSTAYFQKKLQEWKSSAQRWLEDLQRTRPIVEKWMANPESEIDSSSDDEKLSILRERIYGKPLGNTSKRNVAKYYGVAASTIGEWMRGEVKGKKLTRSGKPGFITNQSIIDLDTKLQK